MGDMYRKFIVTVLFAVFYGGVTAIAQVCNVQGVVKLADTSECPEGVHISYKIGGKNYGCITDKDGIFELSFLRGTKTTLKASYMGYTPATKIINCSGKSLKVEILLLKAADEIEGAVLEQAVPLAVVRGDTTVYFAEAYKVNVDATAYDLISQKLPGVGLKDGNLEAHGETVREVFIDGKEFFKNDIGLALKNLPAGVIKEIQFFDKESDYARLTGFDDGNKKKAINIVTQDGIGNSTFGKAYAGVGQEGYYKSYGMFNRFSDKNRLSVFAQWNNISEQNFSMIDLLSATGTASSSAPSQSPYSRNSVDNSFHPTASDDVSSMMVDITDSGETTSQAVGTNYSDTWLKGKINFTGHYLFNRSENMTDYDILDEYFGKKVADSRQDQFVDTKNINHRFNSKIEYDITPKDYLLFRPSFIYQKKSERDNQENYSVGDDVVTHVMDQSTETDQTVFSHSNELMYMHRFGESGHSISANGRFSYISTTENIDLAFQNHMTADNAVQDTYSYNDQMTISGMMSYVCPIGRYSRIKADAGVRYTFQEIKRKSLIKKNDALEFALDSLLSGLTTSDFGGFLCNVSYMYNRRGLSAVAGVEYHAYEYLNTSDIVSRYHTYSKIYPFVFIKYRFGSNQMHFQYKTEQRFPGLMQVQDAVNNVNSAMTVRGNNKLTPAYSNNLSLRLVMPNTDNAHMFVVFSNLNITSDYIGNKRILVNNNDEGVTRRSEVLSYENADGFLSSKTLLAYGFPVKWIKSNINLSTCMDYSKVPGYWNDDLSFNTHTTWSNYLTVGSNISSNLDFVFDVNFKYIKSENRTHTAYNVDYRTLSYGGQVNWTIVPSLKLMVECGKTGYYGSGADKYSAVICNASISYKFLNRKQADICLSCHDIFNQNNNFYITTNELYRREVSTNVLKRHLLVTFTYNFDKRRKNK